MGEGKEREGGVKEAGEKRRRQEGGDGEGKRTCLYETFNFIMLISAMSLGDRRRWVGSPEGRR